MKTSTLNAHPSFAAPEREPVANKTFVGDRSSPSCPLPAPAERIPESWAVTTGARLSAHTRAVHNF
jgi:hypothetical protein